MSCGTTVVINTAQRVVTVNPIVNRTVSVSTNYSIVQQNTINNFYGSANIQKNITPLTTGETNFAVLFPVAFTGDSPTVTATVADINGGSIDYYAFTIYGVTQTGFWAEFSSPINTADLTLHSHAL